MVGVVKISIVPVSKGSDVWKCDIAKRPFAKLINEVVNLDLFGGGDSHPNARLDTSESGLLLF